MIYTFSGTVVNPPYRVRDEDGTEIELGYEVDIQTALRYLRGREIEAKMAPEAVSMGSRTYRGVVSEAFFAEADRRRGVGLPQY